VTPPSTTSIWPVVKLPADEARYTAAPAISTGSPIRLSGVPAVERFLSGLGYEIVRGSSSRGGGEGLVLLRAAVKSGTSVLMACDGPKAPLGDVKPGVVRLAATSGAPIVPIRAWGTNRLTFGRSWTKAVVTVPFHPVAVCLGEPIEIPEDRIDTRPYQLEVARGIADLASWASLWANGAGTPPFTVAPH